MIIVKDLVKTYGKKEKVIAVNQVSFTVDKGEIFGLIGPDGAGKSSIFRILTTLLLADSGQASVAGFDVIKDYKKIRSSVGYMPGKFSLYQDLSVSENLNFFATVFNTTVKENYALIKEIFEQIAPFKNRRAGNLSGGMKQKLALCCTLIHRPTVLFLDEPTTGVDPVSRKEFWEMLTRLKTQGITILVATPYMDEAGLCDRIALMQNGKILSVDSPQNISEAYPNSLFAIKAIKMFALLKALKKNNKIQDSYAFGAYAHVSIDNRKWTTDNNQNKIVPELKKDLEEDGIDVKEIKPIKATVEDCFIKLLK